MTNVHKVDLRALADTIADHLSEPIYCIDEAGDHFVQFNSQVEADGGTFRIWAKSDTNHPEQFQIIVRRIGN